MTKWNETIQEMIEEDEKTSFKRRRCKECGHKFDYDQLECNRWFAFIENKK